MSQPPGIARLCMRVGDRRVHLRHAGAGPRLLLVHGSPANSEYFLPLIGDLAADFCCLSPDTPGFGESQALEPGHAGIADLAEATAALLDALQFGPCLVFGSHTGAGIALELTARRPDLVSGLLLDGLALFEPAEQRDLFTGYFEPLAIDERGGHFARTWTRIRDMFIWFPWTCHDPGRLNGGDLPPPASAHRWVSMFFQAAKTYGEPYRAAIDYGARAIAAAAAQPRPAVYLAHDRDMLYAHLDRLPPLKPGDRVVRTSSAPGRWLAEVRAALAQLASNARPNAGALPVAACADPADRFLTLPQGQLRLRSHGRGPALLMLHDAPDSGLKLGLLAAALSGDARCFIPDLPGCGSSEPLAVPSPSLADYARALDPLVADLPPRFSLYGRGCGGALAVLIAARHPQAVERLILDELALPGCGVAVPDARICPPIAIEPDGSHWFRTWQMLRDSQIFWPWYQTGADGLLRMPGDFSGPFMHDWTTEVMRQPASAHCLPQAAAAFDARYELARLIAPATFLVRARHPLSACAERGRSLVRDAVVIEIADAERADVMRRVLAH